MMRRTLVVLGLVLGVVAACGGSTATGTAQATGTQPTGTQATGTQAGATQTATSAAQSPTGGAPQQLDACSLITSDEASTALAGKPVDPGVVPEPGAHSCLFSTTLLSTDGVEISVTSVADFKPTQSSIPGLTITQVSGIGDDAYYVSMGAGYQVLNVRKGQTTFSVSVGLKNTSDSDLMAAEKTLALAILGRI
jgi:hypothetical protein